MWQQNIAYNHAYTGQELPLVFVSNMGIGGKILVILVTCSTVVGWVLVRSPGIYNTESIEFARNCAEKQNVHENGQTGLTRGKG